MLILNNIVKIYHLPYFKFDLINSFEFNNYIKNKNCCCVKFGISEIDKNDFMQVHRIYENDKYIRLLHYRFKNEFYYIKLNDVDKFMFGLNIKFINHLIAKKIEQYNYVDVKKYLKGNK